VNLFRGGVADKPAGKYSGGMKRRLSVAISLIGSPKVHHFLLLLISWYSESLLTNPILYLVYVFLKGGLYG